MITFAFSRLHYPRSAYELLSRPGSVCRTSSRITCYTPLQMWASLEPETSPPTHPAARQRKHCVLQALGSEMTPSFCRFPGHLFVPIDSHIKRSRQYSESVLP